MTKKLAERHAGTFKRAGETAQKIRAEFRKSAVTAVIAAFGLLTALSWQGTIKLYIDSLVKKLSLPQDPAVYNLYASIIVTLISVIAIMLATRWAGKANDSEPKEKQIKIQGFIKQDEKA